MPKISVVMPTYNAEKHLKEAIDSILNQTYTDFEFLIIDDNSTDGTRDIIKSYSDPRIKLIDGPCRGIAAALNVGLNLAQGEYIARMDADDIALPERFEKQVEFMDNHKEVGICAAKAEYFGNSETKGKQFGNWWSRNNEAEFIRCGILDFINTTPICHPTVMFNKKLLNKYDIVYNEDYSASEDQELWSRACLVFDIYILNTVLLYYRWDGNNSTLSHQEGKMLAQNAREILLKKFYPLYSHFTNDYSYFESETHKLNDAIQSMGNNKVPCKKCENTHKISVIMPTFNAEKYLACAIDSILKQTYTNFEILIVDDNSNDKTRDIINSYNDRRIKLIQGNCTGLAAALNKGIKEAKGKYIARMDADDIALPDRFEKQVEFLETNPDISLVGSWQQYFGECNWIHKPAQDNEEIKGRMIFGCDLCHSTIMFRKDDFVNNNLFYPENSLQEDLELWHKALKKLKFSNLQEVLGQYRISNSSITNKKEDVLIEYEANLVAQNISENFDIDINSINKELITKRGNQFFKKTKKEKIQFQKDLDKLYTLIEKQNKKTQYVEPQILRKVLIWNWSEMCGDCCYIKTKYFQECTFIEKIFSIKNRNNYKVIFVLGIKIKIKRDKFKDFFQSIFSVRNDGIHKIIAILGVKFKIKNKRKVLEKKLNDINAKLDYAIYNQLNNLLEQKDNKENFKKNKVLFLNDTSDDFHHGSCATSFVITQELKRYFKDFDTLNIREIRRIQSYQPIIDCIWDDKTYQEFESENENIISKIEACDVIVVNGEGCLSYYPWNVNLAYLIYIAKNKFKKYVAVINTSVYDDNSEIFKLILEKSLNISDFLAFRDYKSIVNMSYLTKRPIQSFDCLPIYINEYYQYEDVIPQKKYILLTGGNNIPEDFCEQVNNFISKNCLEKDIYFLISNVKTGQEGTKDIELYNKFKNEFSNLNIQLIYANSINEWLSIIADADILISGRFHHTIAAFMLDTLFLTFKTDSPKAASIIGMFNLEKFLVEDLSKVNISDLLADFKNNQFKNIKQNIIMLSKQNFNFMENK